jgi:hypothetical protein
MDRIDYKVFNENLLLTQAYCEEKLKNTSQNNASILRSINPVYNGQPIFSEKRSYLETISGTISIQRLSDYPYDELYQYQLEFKNAVCKPINSTNNYKGKILVATIDEVITDGFSESETNGFIDINDCPPIDTWFYLGRNKNGRVIFAWIPEKFVPVVDNGREVNMLDCFYWYSEADTAQNHWYYNPIENKQETSKPVAFMPNSFWTKVKNLFIGK